MSGLLSSYNNKNLEVRERTNNPLYNTSDKTIYEWMTPSEISDIISDHLIEVIKKDFERTKQRIEAQSI